MIDETTQDCRGRERRHEFLFIILFCLLWLAPPILIANVVIGGLVGALSVTDLIGFEAGREAGRHASEAIFPRYGTYVYLSEIAIWAVLCVTGRLHGANQCRGALRTGCRP